MRAVRATLAGLVLAAALLVPLGSAAAVADAAPALSAPSVTLAVVATEAPGPEPRGPDDPDNAFAPPEYERPWTWWMSVLLLAGLVPMLVAAALVYYLRVRRPSASR